MQNCSETFRKIYNKTVLVAVTSSVQSWKLQITNNEIFVLISVLVFKLLSSKTLVINRKYNGLYQKKSQQRVLKTYLKKKIPLKILDLSVLLLYPWKFQKNKVSPLVPILIPMEILCYFCLISPGNANSLLFNPTLEFSNAISPITLEIPCPQPPTLQPPTPCLGFFWE